MRKFDEGISNFGADPDSVPHYEQTNLSIRTKDWLRDKLSDISVVEARAEGDDGHTGYYQAIRNVKDIVDLYHPNIERSNPKSIKLWTSAEARGKGRKSRQFLKTGRAFRTMFPALTDAEVDTLVTSFRHDMFPKEYTHKVSMEADDFEHAYAGDRGVSENLSTDWCIKHLSNSCMRHNFSNQPLHPTRAYASGHFEIHWLENEAGHIMARMLVGLKHNAQGAERTAAPIYACSQRAADQLNAIRQNMGLEWAERGDWQGLKLLAMPYANGYQAPYIDVSPKILCEANAEEGYLEIDRNGDIDASQYSGLLYSSSVCICSHCEESINPDYSYTHDDMPYCEDCFHDLFSICEHCSESTPCDETSFVMRSTSYGDHEESWCEYCRGHHATEVFSGELYHWADVECARQDGYDVHIPNSATNDDWFYCEQMSVYYPNDEGVALVDGGHLSLEGIADFNKFNSDYQYVWVDNENAYMLEKVSEEEQKSA